MTTTKNGFTIDDALAFIRGATKDELVSMAHAINGRRSDDQHEAKAAFRRGDKVEFSPTKRGYPSIVRGTVSKVNITTVTVVPELGGREWRVSATLLRKQAAPAG